MDFDESLINEFDTTLELRNVSTKGTPLLGSRPLDIVTYSLINARCNENCIITYCTFVLFPHECVKHDYVVMFHAYDKLE